MYGADTVNLQCYNDSVTSTMHAVNLLTVYNYDLTYDLLFVCVVFALGLF